MKKNFGRIFIFWTMFLLLVGLGFTYFLERSIKPTEEKNSLVLLNEIEQLTCGETGNNPAKEAIADLKMQLQLKSGEEQKRMVVRVSFVWMFFLFLYGCGLLGYLYWKMVRPFRKLETFSQQIAKGDLDIELKYERANFFGAFTWAFDHMRKEIKQSKANEERAIKENKTIIAALSHDIKTPIASIRAYAEGLEANLNENYEQRERYVQVIMKKCDEVTKLTNDLVLHSLSELDSLEIKEQEIEIGSLLEQTISDLEYPMMCLRKPIPEGVVLGDAKRVVQVMENLVNNAQKYAPGAKLEVWAQRRDGMYEIHVRDYGQGIVPEDMPFVFDKFYRGKNVEGKNGSGLGLYIVKYIMNRMNGEVSLINREDGLEAVLKFRMV